MNVALKSVVYGVVLVLGSYFAVFTAIEQQRRFEMLGYTPSQLASNVNVVAAWTVGVNLAFLALIGLWCRRRSR
jgi:hypothetical protein